METKLIPTSDGSFTVKSQHFDETYHSINGAIAESVHIFINLGLKNFTNTHVNILEIGYGTGLNALLTFKNNQELNNEIFYHGIEKFPIDKDTFYNLNYGNTICLDENILPKFCNEWNKEIKISQKFTLFKDESDFTQFIPTIEYNLIYMDAFSPNTQPEMWNIENLRKVTEHLSPNGILVTYCCKGIVKQTLRELGLTVKRMPGPFGKRHVIFAKKIICETE